MAERPEDKEKPHRGEAAPLEGAVGPEIMRVLNIAFLGMGIGMCNQLAMTVQNTMSGPLLSNEAGVASERMGFNPDSIKPTVAPIEMKMPTPKFGL